MEDNVPIGMRVRGAMIGIATISALGLREAGPREVLQAEQLHM
jgi:hypothetical protein